LLRFFGRLPRVSGSRFDLILPARVELPCAETRR
jgi:hypothetical protein